jgi:hypothetical protein
VTERVLARYIRKQRGFAPGEKVPELPGGRSILSFVLAFPARRILPEIQVVNMSLLRLEEV